MGAMCTKKVCSLFFVVVLILANIVLGTGKKDCFSDDVKCSKDMLVFSLPWEDKSKGERQESFLSVAQRPCGGNVRTRGHLRHA